MSHAPKPNSVEILSLTMRLQDGSVIKKVTTIIMQKHQCSLEDAIEILITVGLRAYCFDPFTPSTN